MTIEEIKESLCTQLMTEIAMQDLNLFKKSSRQIFSECLDLAYGVGFDEGYKIAKKESHGSKAKKLQPINELGYPSKPYLSVIDASRDLNINERNLRKAIKSGKKCGGYYWKYA